MKRKKINDQTYVDVWARQKGVCGGCGDHLDDVAYENHHLKRVVDGGENDVDNLVLLCPDCHYHYHDYNTRKAIETTEDQYPYYDGPQEGVEPPDEIETFEGSDEMYERISDLDEIDEKGESL